MFIYHSAKRRSPERRLAVLFATLTLAWMFTAGAALAGAEAWDIDSSHSGVSFQIRHFFSMVSGRFSSFHGAMLFDEKDPTRSSMEFTIDATSISTDNEKRDGHLKSPDFFNVEKFPTLTFKSTKIEKGADANHFSVTGDFTMIGVTKPITVQVQLLGIGPDAWGGTRAGFTATGVVNRKDFGMVWNKALDNGGTMLSDEVNITVNLEVAKKKA
jgi:polyisoprenoid-binding protein YceI